VKTSRQQVRVIIEGREYLVEISDLSARPIIATVDGKTYQVYIEGSPGSGKPQIQAVEDVPESMVMQNASVFRSSKPPVEVREADVFAPIPGDIVEIFVQPGDQVRVGQPLCVLEAMKMKNTIRASRDGRIRTVEITPGQTVDHGTVLFRFE
jgi:biotin carboxyl carrier protein